MGSQRYLNDGDAEKLNDQDPDNGTGNHEDGDGDSSEEYEETYDNGRYHDQDDQGILEYGHAAGASERSTIVQLVKRYYAAAAVGDGVAACSMLAPELATAAPQDEGGAAGPAYLRGGKTCQAIMSTLFKHFHARLSDALSVTEVRRKGNQALALVGSPAMPAGDVSLSLVGRAWRIDSLLGKALP